MRLVVQDAPALKSAVDSIVCLVEEGQFEVKADGLHLKAMDPSQISMISFTMPKEAFIEYNAPEEMKIGTDIGQLSNVLARGKKGEKAELSVEEGRLVIRFFGDKHKRTFKVPLIETGDRVQREPKIEFKNTARIRADAFKETLKDAKLISSHVRLALSRNPVRRGRPRRERGCEGGIRKGEPGASRTHSPERGESHVPAPVS